MSHLPFRSWCSACLRGREIFTIGHHNVDTKTNEGKGCDAPIRWKALMTDLDFMGSESFSSKIRSHALLPCVTLSRNGWHGESVPEASPKGESKSNGEVQRAIQSVRGLARTLNNFPWRNSLESHWNLEVRCWPGWLSSVPIFPYSSTKVSRTMATRLACD